MQTLNLTKKYEKYSEYKDSGVLWLGKIPKEWEISKARKFISTIESGVWGDEPAQDQYDIKCLRVADFNYDSFSFSEVETIRNIPKLSNNKILKKFDILIEKSGGGEKTPVGRAVLFDSDEKMVCANFIDIIRTKENIIPKFFNFQLYSAYLSKLNLKSIKQNTGIQNLDTYSYFSEFFPIPKKDEQQKIVNYLDEKTIMIDQIIEKKQKQIELLREKRIAVINHAVNDVEGVTEKLKYIAPERRQKLDLVPRDLKYVALENIESNTGKFIESAEEVQLENSTNIFKTGDVLFGKLRPYLAKVFSPDFEGVCSGEFLTLVTKQEKVLQKFLFYKLISQDFIKAVNDSTYGTKMPRANWQFIGNQRLTYPFIAEQQKIVDSVDKKTKTIYEFIQKVEKSIELLQEFKSSLISNVVTGKIKV